MKKRNKFKLPTTTIGWYLLLPFIFLGMLITALITPLGPDGKAK